MATRRSIRLSSSMAEVAAPPPLSAPTRKRKSTAASGAVAVEVPKEAVAPKTPRATKKRKVEAEHALEDAVSAVAGVSSSPKPTANGTASATPKRAKRGPTRAILPHMTNAPLITPRGSRVVAVPVADAPSISPTKVRPGQVTTDNLLDTACRHLLTVDPKLKPVIDKHYCSVLSPERLAEEINPFKSLASGIIGQQVSGAAASSIERKFLALFPGGDQPEPRYPLPQEVADTKLERLRTAGLSQRKAEYIQGLAAKFAAGELTAKMLVEASDEEIIEKLTAVRGLGAWSVQMFSFFALKRTDIFSTGDLGVQRGMAVYMGKDVAKLRNKGGKWKYMSEQDMLDISAKFSPYRSLFMWYMWQMADTDVSIVQNK